MSIICAPASFKECLSAAEVAAAMARGVRHADPARNCDVCPVGDGGEGTMDALVNAVGGEFRRFTVAGPLGQTIDARLGFIDRDRIAVVELAEAAGLELVPIHLRDPTRTTTLGVGQLIRQAVNAGVDEIIVCIGGSATVDGGTGLAQALGWRFLDAADHDLIKPLMCGGLLQRIARIIAPPPDEFAKLPRILVACDVDNPLCGPNGAAAVYGPQKGATPEQVQMLDAGLAHLAKLVGGDPHRRGAGAAGGAGFGLVQFCGATLQPGIDLVLDAVRFDDRLRGASLVLTGEGRLDAQSLQGKACMGVARGAAKFGVPTIAIVGSTGPGSEQCVGSRESGLLQGFVDLSSRFGRERSMTVPAELITQCAGEITREFSQQPPMSQTRLDHKLLPGAD